MNSAAWFDALRKDLSYGCRVLLKSPGYTLVGVLSLAIGIGANTAMFGVVRAVLLRPLPYPRPQQLMQISHATDQTAVTIPEFQFWRANTAAFSSATGYRGSSERMLAVNDRQEPVRALSITDDFFRTLGMPLAFGHEFSEADTHPGAPQSIILGNDLWRRAFAADPSAVGRTVMIDNAPFQIAGVAAAGFWFPTPADAYVPILITGSLADLGTNTFMIARVRPGFGPQALKSSLAAAAVAFRQSGKGPRKHPGLQAFSLQESIVGDVRLKLLLLFGVVAAMLLIACLNLAGLLLARLSARRREVAVRLAIGSSAARLVAQFAAENALLIATGCGAGVLLARWLLEGLVAVVPFSLPSSQPIRLDWPTLAFAVGLATVMALAFSLAPLFTARRIAVYEALKAGRASSGSCAARPITRGILVVAEVALSAVLLVSAVLLMQSLYRLNSEPLGFSPRGVLAFSTPRERYRNPASQRVFQEQLLSRLENLPGISSAGAVDHLPLTGHANMPTSLLGHPDLDIGGMEIRAVSPGFFTALRIPLLRGRAIQASDTAGSAPVIVVNEAVVRQWWPKDNPLGGLVHVGRFHGRDFTGGAEPPRQVIGVVADVKTEFLNAPAKPTVYLPIAQTPKLEGGISWVVRADRLDGLGDRLRAIVSEIDSHQRVVGMREMPDIVSATTRDSRFDAWLFGLFALLALALAALGIYGLLAFSVARRTNEFGIRMALGANRGSVLRIVLRQGAFLVALGLALGFAAAYAVTRFLESLLYGVKSHDPVSFAAVVVVLFAAGIAASYLPARRATRVDPMAALRYE